jgi:hypothetical protein
MLNARCATAPATEKYVCSGAGVDISRLEMAATTAAVNERFDGFSATIGCRRIHALCKY